LISYTSKFANIKSTDVFLNINLIIGTFDLGIDIIFEITDF